MILKSFSKINLSLSVNKKLKKIGLHDIQSYFCLINLYDQIKIKKIKGQKDKVKFQGKFSKLIKKKNSITNILAILREKNLISNYYSVLVNKKIPVFAGLGGGTSNAVYLVKYLTRGKISKDLLRILEKKIGSDLKLFFYEQGFLESLKKINNFRRKYKLYFLLIYPNIKCSTHYIYSKVKKNSLKSQFKFNNINSKSRFIEFLINQNNDLQLVVEKKYPAIKTLIEEIGKKEGCYFSRMTGSGSACYGVFESEKVAKAALNGIKLKYPKYWSSVAKTI
jgi:4-diphosphocytidyl-2-C-methyl-D-erythritol kinase|tara:strand:+ start:535 stop:1371 length:837 start_codon:yes stop_codon:yes gene_type:complete